MSLVTKRNKKRQSLVNKCFTIIFFFIIYVPIIESMKLRNVFNKAISFL